MQFADLIADAASDQALPDRSVERFSLGGPRDVEVTSMTLDSRQVERGALYCCVPGRLADGHDFAPAAVEAGAVALLCERPLGLGVPEVVVPSVRAAMGPVASALAGHPSSRLVLVGFTGTNGKTTATHLLASVLQAAGWPVATIGTLTGARTTPEAPELQAALAGFVADGARAVVMEVSSHALDQHRVDACRFDVSVFTNLSRDHLDYHQDVDSYFRAKARLFEPTLSDRAVVNLDDAHGRLLLDAAAVPTVGYSLDDASAIEVSPTKTRFRWHGEAVELALAGRFNVSNALAAATVAGELGIDPKTVADGLSAAGPVPGRFEPIDEGQPFTVVVDYAHTPDGLANVLGAARELAGGHQVVVVFGCGGNRDRPKRPEMGRIAVDRADRVIVTNDNPRDEDPGSIIEAILAGAPDRSRLTVEPDRAAAIALAVSAAGTGDVVVIAGKGHETTQVIGSRTIEFDDRVVARRELGHLGHDTPGATA